MKKLNLIVWVGILLFGWSGELNELSSQGTWKTYTVKNGLLPNFVYNITQDKHGNYWVATHEGVCWMDSNENWFVLKDPTRFDSSWYFKKDILIDYQNNKWLIAVKKSPTYSKEYIVCYNDSIFTYFDLNRIYMCFGLDANQYIWAGTLEEYAFWYDGIQWHPFYVPGTIYWDSIFDFQLDKNGRFYIAHENGISTSEGYFLWDDWGTGMPVFDLTLDKQNNLLGATPGGVVKYDGKNWQILTTNDGLLSNGVGFIAVDSSNQIWVDYREHGFIGKVSCFNGITWQHFELEGPFPDWWLGKIYVGRDGSVWIGTYQQIYVYQDTTTTNVRNRSDLKIPIQRQYALAPVYPNPCKNQTQIRYYLNTSQIISLTIYNIIGKEVITLENSKKGQGTYITSWNGTDKNCNLVCNGIYLLVLKSNGLVHTRTICVLR